MAEKSPAHTVVVEGGVEIRQHIQIGPFSLVADGPVEYGGTDTGPNPYDLLLASLGACTAMTIAGAAKQKQWPLERIRVTLNHASIYARDCAECQTRTGTINQLTREIELFGGLSEDQRRALLDAAERCPVSQALTSEINLQSRLVPPAA